MYRRTPDEGLGLRGSLAADVVRRGPNPAAVVPDHHRQFTASRPNQLWVSDFTYVRPREGFVYTAFVIDVLARRIVGWKVSTAMRIAFVLDALEQAIPSARRGRAAAIWSTTATAACKTSRCTTPNASPMPASLPRWAVEGTGTDNALAQSLIGLYKTEVIGRRDRWAGAEAVESATLRAGRLVQSSAALGPLASCLQLTT